MLFQGSVHPDSSVLSHSSQSTCHSRTRNEHNQVPNSSHSSLNLPTPNPVIVLATCPWSLPKLIKAVPMIISPSVNLHSLFFWLIFCYPWLSSSHLVMLVIILWMMWRPFWDESVVWTFEESGLFEELQISKRLDEFWYERSLSWQNVLWCFESVFLRWLFRWHLSRRV